jgi:arylsulfatase A-like enzyme
MRIPGVKPAIITYPVSQIDMVPTLLELMGVPAPSSLQGRSLLPAIRGERQMADPVYLEWNPFPDWESQLEDCPEWAGSEDCRDAVQTSIRTVVTPDGWKLNWSSMDKSQLFGLEEDPKEKENLFYEEAYAGKVRELQGLIKGWQARTADLVSIERED